MAMVFPPSNLTGTEAGQAHCRNRAKASALICSQGTNIPRLGLMLGEPALQFLPLGLSQVGPSRLGGEAVPDLVHQRQALVHAEAVNPKLFHRGGHCTVSSGLAIRFQASRRRQPQVAIQVQTGRLVIDPGTEELRPRTFGLTLSGEQPLREACGCLPGSSWFRWRTELFQTPLPLNVRELQRSLLNAVGLRQAPHLAETGFAGQRFVRFWPASRHDLLGLFQGTSQEVHAIESYRGYCRPGLLPVPELFLLCAAED
jgi:hypothetical protein